MEATRITEGSATLIDYIFANTYAMNAMGGNLVSQISDNLPQFLIVNHRMIICFFFKSVHTTQDGIRLSVTLVHYLPTLGILYLLMFGKSSRFLVFVKISRIL